MQNACAINTVEIMTFKSGKFILSAKCDFAEIMPLIVESSVLYRTIRELPILPKIASRLDESLMVRSIHGTVAIEGNPLNEEQVDGILAGEQSIDDNRAVTEILNLKKAYDGLLIDSKKDEPLIVTQAYIRQVHRMITDNLEYNLNVPGGYRNYRVEVGDTAHGGKYVPPKILTDIETIMNQFEKWINSKELVNLDSFVRSAIAHYYIGVIHPFGDGNGRTARFVEAAILSYSGYKYVPKMLSNYYYKNVDEYYRAFRKAEKDLANDITPFIRFVLNGVINSLNEIKSIIIFHIRNLALRDYIIFLRNEKRITQRQFDLLQILAENPKSFTKKDLYSSPPFSILYRKASEDTLKRDIKRLLGLNLLVMEGASYKLNFFALE